MINVVIDKTSYCKGCQIIELEIINVPEDLDDYGNPITYSQDIVCKYEAACNRMYYFMRQFYEDCLGVSSQEKQPL